MTLTHLSLANLDALRTAWRQVWPRLSWPGSLGLLAVLGALLWAGVLAPQREQALAALQAQADEARLHALRLQRLARARAQAPDAAGTEAGFVAAFAPADQRQARVAALWDLAERRGLAPRRGEFRHGTEADLPLARYRMVLPLSGPYAALGGAVAQALQDDPGLSLDSLTLSRAAEPGSVKAELAWSLWMQPAAAPAPGGRR